ncbi:polyprenyl synthetase family protein [Microlunatus panaciterrae]
MIRPDSPTQLGAARRGAHPTRPTNQDQPETFDGPDSPTAQVLAMRRPALHPDLVEHLGLVDGLLRESLSDLMHLWTHRLDDNGPVDILADADLPQLLEQLVSTGGKRIRPMMSYLGWLTASGKSRGIGHAEVVQVGAALELLHLFALVHDDVMDESGSRRGQPTVHTRTTQLHIDNAALGSAQRFGESIAILLGDLAHAEADHLVAGLPQEMRRIWRLLVVELVCGQRRDLTGGAAGRRDLGHARQVARMKSGGYTVQRPLQLGAAAAKAPDVVNSALISYGREVGEAFALRDDLLGALGDPAQTGKPAGDDLISGKPTVILSLAEGRLSDPEARAALARVGTETFGADDVELLQHQLRADGVVAAVEEMISAHVESAIAALDERSLDPDGVTQLVQMAHQIAWRDR